MTVDVCWICGATGPLTKEHRTKKSDLRAVFGNVATGSELYWHDSSGRKNVRVPSLDAGRLKSDGRICAPCNNSRTQPHDTAWEALSKALRAKLSAAPDLRTLRGVSVFPYGTRRQLLNVHLFFAKLFGCYIVEDNIPLDHTGLANAILEEKPHPNLYLNFGLGPLFKGARFTGRTQIDVVVKGPYFASFWYCVSPIAVQVLLTEDKIGRYVGGWHPKLGTTKLDLIDFEALLERADAMRTQEAS